MGSISLAVRKPIFETGIEGAEYGIAGTAFLVSVREQVFALTAWHVIRNVPMSEVLILCSHEKDVALPFDLLACAPAELTHPVSKNVGTDDMSAAFDFAWARVRKSHLPEGVLDTATLFQLEPPAANRAPLAGARVKVIGYPTESATIDYDAKHIELRLESAVGILDSTSELLRCSRVIGVESSAPSLDGFSGGPAYVGTDTDPLLVGMAIRGDAEAKIIHVLDANNIAQILYNIVASYPAEMAPHNVITVSHDMWFR